MGMQKFYAGFHQTQPDGAVYWYATDALRTLSKIENCRLVNMQGGMRATVYAAGHADTWFSVPAVCSLRGCKVTGYITGDDAGNYVFHHCYF
jgi:hypothetical protein